MNRGRRRAREARHRREQAERWDAKKASRRAAEAADAARLAQRARRAQKRPHVDRELLEHLARIGDVALVFDSTGWHLADVEREGLERLTA